MHADDSQLEECQSEEMIETVDGWGQGLQFLGDKIAFGGKH